VTPGPINSWQLRRAGSVAATLVSVVVTPANPSVVAGSTRQFTATGHYSDSTTRGLTSTATWSSGTPSKATIGSTGLATGVAAGTTSISATSGGIAGSTTLTVTAASSPPPTSGEARRFLAAWRLGRRRA
jgi:uncharacterized protein YjdB